MEEREKQLAKQERELERKKEEKERKLEEKRRKVEMEQEQALRDLEKRLAEQQVSNTAYVDIVPLSILNTYMKIQNHRSHSNNSNHNPVPKIFLTDN